MLARIVGLLAAFFASVPAPLGPLGTNISCLNEKGQPVDVWLAVKGPTGTNYWYADSAGSAWGPSPYSMNDTGNGALSWTTKQLWSAQTAAYALYNDEPPNNESYSYSYGHTKGFFAFSADGNGFWLTHSVPLFPTGPAGSSTYTGLGGNAYTYAQNLACFSVSARTLDAMAYKFLLNRPRIYESLFPSQFESIYPNISALLKGQFSVAKICSYETMNTLAGMEFNLFAKTAAWGKDLWDGCVAPAYRSDLWVESWIRGSEEGPDCPVSGYDTLDVQGVQFGADFGWGETQDHSKWGLVVNRSILCFGDINRMTTQYSRGGGTVCWMNNTLESAFQKAVSGLDSCSK